MDICEKLEQYFVDLLHGEGWVEFQNHLPTCPKCQQGLKQLARFHVELRQALDLGLRVSTA